MAQLSDSSGLSTFLIGVVMPQLEPGMIFNVDFDSEYFQRMLNKTRVVKPLKAFILKWYLFGPSHREINTVVDDIDNKVTFCLSTKGTGDWPLFFYGAVLLECVAYIRVRMIFPQLSFYCLLCFSKGPTKLNQAECQFRFQISTLSRVHNIN